MTHYVHVASRQDPNLVLTDRMVEILREIAAGRKVGGVVMYNLRHSCLTNLAAAGVPDTTARAISGHKTDSAHRRYVITHAATKAAALTAMEAIVSRAGQGPGA